MAIFNPACGESKVAKKSFWHILVTIYTTNQLWCDFQISDLIGQFSSILIKRVKYAVVSNQSVFFVFDKSLTIEVSNDFNLFMYSGPVATLNRFNAMLLYFRWSLVWCCVKSNLDTNSNFLTILTISLLHRFAHFFSSTERQAANFLTRMDVSVVKKETFGFLCSTTLAFSFSFRKPSKMTLCVGCRAWSK